MIYAYLDRAVTDLAEPDLFMLVAMRTWVAAARSGRCGCAALAQGFNARAVPDALRDFSMAMMTIDRDGRERLRLMPVGARCVSDGEARLLALFALARGGADTGLHRAAAGLVDDEAVSRLERAAGLVGHALQGDAA